MNTAYGKFGQRSFDPSLWINISYFDEIAAQSHEDLSSMIHHRCLENELLSQVEPDFVFDAVIRHP
jgi:hypothetical protein